MATDAPNSQQQENETEQRAGALRARIRAADRAYYEQDSPIISDAEYDELLQELRALEARHPEIVTADSPTRIVSGAPAAGFAKVRHRTPMLSLANARSPEELLAWRDRAARVLPQAVFRYVCEPKIDGLSMNLTYERGKLVLGATRGDGLVGEDVTANVRTIKDVPQRLKNAYGAPIPEIVEVRGEVYMRHSDFEALNTRLAEEAEQAGSAPRLFANARNSAAGSLRQKDPQITASRPLSFLAYHLGALEGADEPATQTDLQAWLRAWGFSVSPLVTRVETIEEAQTYADQRAATRFDLGYDIDGAVIKIDERWQQQELGSVGRDPRWAIAYKFAPAEGNTKLLGVNVSVGRTGALTPIASLAPLKLGGVTITSAQLFNEDEVRRKDLRIGDTVVVQRHGDVIPGIVKAMVELRDGTEQPWIFPTNCPVCTTPVVRAEGGAVTYCPNLQCPARHLENVIHFAAVMDIRGLGDAIAERLVGSALIHDVADLYHLTKEQLLTLPGFQEKSAENLLRALARSKSQPFERVLCAIGVRMVGEKAAESLAQGFRSSDALLAASETEISALPGVGPKIARSVYEWLQEERNRQFIERLKAAGLRMAVTDDGGAATDGLPFSGQTFLLTGSLSQLTRGQAEQAIQSLGGKIAASVTKSLDHLVVGDAPGSKVAKAEKLGVPTRTEEWLVERLRAHGAMPEKRERLS
jgi:DNA ligase (NAD+)